MFSFTHLYVFFHTPVCFLSHTCMFSFTHLYVFFHTPVCLLSHTCMSSFTHLYVFFHTPVCFLSHTCMFSFTHLYVFFHTPVCSGRAAVIFLDGLVVRKSLPFGSFLHFPLIGQTGVLSPTRDWKHNHAVLYSFSRRFYPETLTNEDIIEAIRTNNMRVLLHVLVSRTRHT